MQRFHTLLTVILGFALVLSVVAWRQTRRELQQQLHTVTDANGLLRETLGDLTTAITEKDKEIDRLHSSCGAREQRTPNRSFAPRFHKVESTTSESKPEQEDSHKKHRKHKRSCRFLVPSVPFVAISSPHKVARVPSKFRN